MASVIMQYHPEYVKVLQSFKDIDCYKYAAYRTALKIQRIQKIIKMHNVDIRDISVVFGNHGFNKNSCVMSLEEIESLLITLYDVANHRRKFVEEVSSLVEIVLNLFHSTFCSNLVDSLTPYQIKLTLAVFCGGKLADKYKYIINLFATDGFIIKEHIHLMLSCFAKICENLGEKYSFGLYLVPSAVLNCLQFFKESTKVHMTSMIEWLFREPQTLVWLSTHHRLAASKNVKHNAKCSICECYPLVGLRYTCLCCYSYNLCQQCFLLGLINKNHKIKHTMQEFCQKASSWLEMKIAFVVLRNKICFPEKYKQSYLPCSRPNSHVKSFTSNEEMCFDRSLAADTTLNLSIVLKELSTFISKLETENRQKCTKVKKLNSGNFENEEHRKSMDRIYRIKQEVLENNDCQLESQLLRLYNLLLRLKAFMTVQLTQKTCVSPESKIPLKIDGYYESTPILATGQSSLQPNLGAFLKYQCDVSEVKNTRETPSNSCQDILLYSIADLDVTTCNSDTRCEIADESSARNILSDTLRLKSVNSSSSSGCKDSTENKVKCNAENNLEFDNKMEFSNICVCQPSILAGKSPLDGISENALKILTPKVNSSFSFSKICIPETSDSEKNMASGTDYELQQLLDQVEGLFPRMTGTHPTFEKDQLLHALSEMEVALGNLSS